MDTEILIHVVTVDLFLSSYKLLLDMERECEKTWQGEPYLCWEYLAKNAYDSAYWQVHPLLRIIAGVSQVESLMVLLYPDRSYFEAYRKDGQIMRTESAL